MASFGKRAAGRELNHDNWNEEEESEEAGEFKRASVDELQKRAIKVAKRRAPTSDSTDAPANPFSGFGGFKMSNNFSTSTPAVSSSASTPFAFLAKIPSVASSTTMPLSASKTTPIPTTNGNYTDKKTTDDKENDSKSNFQDQLKQMNLQFLDWIKKHLNDDAIVDLTPCFKSYEDHLKSLKDSKQKENINDVNKKSETNSITTSSFKFGVPADKKETPTTPSNVIGSPSNNNSGFASFKFGAAAGSTDSIDKKEETSSKPPAFGISSGFSFGSKSNAAETQAAPTASTFSFGAPSKPVTSPLSKPAAAAPTFSFGLANASTKPDAKTTTSFGFGGSGSESAPSSTPSFSFGLKATSTQAGGLFGGLSSGIPSFGNVTQIPKPAEPQAEEDEEPPKNEFTPVVEDDSLYTKRCKVFVKGDTDFADRGIGTLYIKKVEEKIQMVVRADTNLGNILLNIMLVDGLPASRMGKNNVMLVCVPTPDAKPPPTSVLLRVKTGEEADELLEMINKHKQKN